MDGQYGSVVQQCRGKVPNMTNAQAFEAIDHLRATVLADVTTMGEALEETRQRRAAHDEWVKSELSAIELRLYRLGSDFAALASGFTG